MMDAVSDARTAPGSSSLRRDVGHRVLGGVCAGLARQLGVDPVLVRLGFLVGALAGGIGAVLYLVAWAAIPADGAVPRQLGPALGRRQAWQVGIGSGCLVLAALLSLRALGFWLGDALAWPLVLAAAGGALIWRQSVEEADPRAVVGAAPPAPGSAPGAATPRPAGRATVGAALVVAAGLALISLNASLRPSGSVLVVVAVVLASLALILAPWGLRLLRNFAAERAERVRSQERAELAAHLHDSVLQTLALVQRRADDPRQVTALARRQERELRAWLNRGTERSADSLAAALERAAAEVEDAHEVAIEVVTVGDRPLDERAGAVVAAAREALTNAAKFAPQAAISVYAEARGDRLEVYVRDRGEGFDQASVPDDRRGVSESIVGRMRRHGGRAAIHSAPGQGTEVELIMEQLP
jgi:signal transduction histidine kinase